jgi:vibriolysin
VHYDKDFNNAFWNGKQMVYGDGDGVTFSPFGRDESIVCHEWTHAVISATSNLRYYGESGALNEAFSDIMGISSVIHNTHVPNPDASHPSPEWAIGSKVVIDPPLFPGSGCTNPPGIRFMDDPICDGSSIDDYQKFSNHLAVHSNSGIANLAYHLTVDGGSHPRGETDIAVDGIGIEQAQRIYYLAFTQYLIASSDFSHAKAATILAANSLYASIDQDAGPSAQARAVENAWNAVNVPDSELFDF